LQVSTDVADQPRLLDVGAVAEACGVSTSHVYDHIALHDFPIPHLRIGKLIRFRRTDVEAFVVGNGDA
jgi:excisionase family DNA binding protein